MNTDFSDRERNRSDAKSIQRPLIVLLVSLFHPELVRGGAQQVCYDVFKEFEQRPDIQPFLLASIDNSFPSLNKSGARITGFDGRPNEFLFLSKEYDYWWHRTSDYLLLEAYGEFLKQIEPDVIHFHHFLTLGVDLLSFTRKILPNVKIIFTFHEFMTICAADGHMVRKTDKSLCTKASAVRCNQCFPETPPEQFFLRENWMRKHMSVVDKFTVPSKFMAKQYVDWGIDPRNIVHVPNGINFSKQEFFSQDLDSNRTRNRFGFFGQMVDAKGIHVILEAVDYLRGTGFTDFSVEINGDNLRYASPEYQRIIEEFFDNEKKLPLKDRKVTLNGPYQSDQIRMRMERIDWCIVPSVWWEIFCLVISEAWTFGRPVIASNIGGPFERITHDSDGLLFQMGNAVSLGETMKRACEETGLWGRLNSGITLPLKSEVMADKYCEVYLEI